jgi:hypothetical protein
MTQLFITVGIMVSFLFGLAIPAAPEVIDWDINSKHPENYAAWMKFANDPMVNNYWRFMFGFPLLISAIQIILMLTIFKYDTPKFLK